MNTVIRKIRSVPRWGIAAGIIYFAVQVGLYRLGAYLSEAAGFIAFARECRIAVIDDRIPLIPVFAVIYLFSYVFWIMGPMAVSMTKKRNFVNFIAGLTMAYLIGFAIFVFVPTYMDRVKEGLLGAAAKPDIFSRMLNVIYSADGGETAFNLFPSYHCLISAYCYLGVCGQEEISKGFRVYSFIVAVLISLSTLFTRQHYFADMIGGIGISLFCWMLMNKLDPGKRFA